MIPEFNIWLCTLQDVQDWQQLDNSNTDWTPIQVRLLKMYIRQASQQAATWLGWIPLPYVATHEFDFSREYISADCRTLILDAPLLNPTTLTNGDGTTIASSGYVLKENNGYPKRYVELARSGGLFFQCAANGDTAQVISLAGEWGYVPHYGRHWKNSGIVLPMGGLSDSAVSVTVSSAAPFQIGDYLRIGDETLFITDISTNTLTLERGVLGTTAAAHDAGDAIQIFQQLDDIRMAVAEWAAYLYKTRDRLGESVQIFDRHTTVVNQLSPQVKVALAQHRRPRKVVKL